MSLSSSSPVVEWVKLDRMSHLLSTGKTRGAVVIRYRNGAYEVVVYVGRDPATNKERNVSRTVRMPEQKRTPQRVLDLEAKLRIERSQGVHGGPNITVGELLDRWIEHAASNLQPTTVFGYKRSIRLYLKPGIGSIRLAKLTTAHLDYLYRNMVKRGGVDGAPLSPATVRQTHAIIRRALHQAERWGWLHTNPARLAEPPSQTKRADTTPRGADIAALIEAANDDLAFAIRLAAVTGARRGELVGLRWSDIDFEAGVIRIERAFGVMDNQPLLKSTKSGKPRSVPIGPNSVAFLRARRTALSERALRFGAKLAPTAYVLSEDLDGAGALNPNKLTDRFGNLTDKLGVPTRFHDLRHAAATNALAAGAPPADVAAHLGHSSTTITLDTYGHPTPGGQRRVAEILDAI